MAVALCNITQQDRMKSEEDKVMLTLLPTLEIPRGSRKS